MELTMLGEYAVRAMIYLAGLPPGKTASIAEISLAWGIPETFLRKISAQLAKGGLLVTQRGSRGGIRLAKSGETITLLEVIEAVEGKISLNKCMIASDFCHRSPYCGVHNVWAEAQYAVRSILGSKTLHQLAIESDVRKAAS
jgi:Rrf2 family protein